MKLKLLSKRGEISDIKTFVFEPETPISWKAGQYLIYSLPHKNEDLRGKMRFFTISSSPFEKKPSITTRISKNKISSFKKALDNLKIGDMIFAKGPDGDFVVDDAKNKHIFIAGGIGITPFISIIKQLNNDSSPINVTLLYANKNQDIPFRDELEKIVKAHPEFKIRYFISPERIDDNSLKNLIKNFKKPIFYVSGPDPMVEQTEKLLLELGVKKANIKSDYFSGYKAI